MSKEIFQFYISEDIAKNYKESNKPWKQMLILNLRFTLQPGSCWEAAKYLEFTIVCFRPLYKQSLYNSIQIYDFYRLFTNLYNLLFPFLAAFNVKSKCIFYFLSTWFWSKDSSLLFTFLYQEAKVKSKWNSQIYFWIYFFTLLLFADVHIFGVSNVSISKIILNHWGRRQKVIK